MATNRLQNEARHPTVELVYGADAFIWEWHCSQGKLVPQSYKITDAIIGIQIDGKIIGSVIYSRYRPPDIEIGIYTIDKRWCNKRVLSAIFDYPFNQLQCKRVTAQTDPANPAVCNFLKRIGFIEEGRLRQALPHGDALVLGMLRHECRWVK